MWLHQEQTRGKHTINIPTFHQDILPTTLTLHICSVHVYLKQCSELSTTARVPHVCLSVAWGCDHMRTNSSRLCMELGRGCSGYRTLATSFIPSLVSLHHYYVRKSHWLVSVTQYLASHKEPLSHPILQTDQEVRRHKVVWHPTSGHLSTLIHRSICMCT